MLKTNTSQRDISRYLNQIREAINSDFVPLFLGAGTRPRTFFLSHNTKSMTVLHNLEYDDLCIVCDGTYTRIGKN